MNKFLTILAAALFALAACTGKSEDPAKKLPDPDGLEISAATANSLTLQWNDNADEESGYQVFIRTNKYDVTDPVTTLKAGSVKYTFRNLSPDTRYFCGVRAIADDYKRNSGIVFTEGTTLKESAPAPQPDPVVPEISISSVKTGYAYAAITYSISKATPSKPFGICISESGTPAYNDTRLPGPAYFGSAKVHLSAPTSFSGSITQLIPGALLKEGKSYKARVYATSGDGVIGYSEEKTLSIPASPEGIHLDWSEVSGLSLPSAIKVYKTTSQLSGRNFNAWYAIADCSGEIECRVLYPSAPQKLETQSANAGDCYVLINGGIFGKYNKQHLGVTVVDGVKSAWRDADPDATQLDSRYWGIDHVLYNITRAIFGVDASGKPGAYWVGYPDADNLYFYDRPLATVMGEDRYGKPSATLPAAPVSWTPKYALSTGPMLLYGGKVIISNETTGKSAVWEKADGGDGAGHDFYYTHQECWAPDIYEGRPDRTAVGFTADGKVVLFICDGRITASQGATLVEVAKILKDLGCVAAMNLDGGGSTAMTVNGTRLNYGGDENRAVVTTVGFFKKN